MSESRATSVVDEGAAGASPGGAQSVADTSGGAQSAARAWDAILGRPPPGGAPSVADTDSGAQSVADKNGGAQSVADTDSGAQSVADKNGGAQSVADKNGGAQSVAHNFRSLLKDPPRTSRSSIAWTHFRSLRKERYVTYDGAKSAEHATLHFSKPDVGASSRKTIVCLHCSAGAADEKELIHSAYSFGSTSHMLGHLRTTHTDLRIVRDSLCEQAAKTARAQTKSEKRARADQAATFRRSSKTLRQTSVSRPGRILLRDRTKFSDLTKPEVDILRDARTRLWIQSSARLPFAFFEDPAWKTFLGTFVANPRGMGAKKLKDKPKSEFEGMLGTIGRALERAQSFYFDRQFVQLVHDAVWAPHLKQSFLGVGLSWRNSRFEQRSVLVALAELDNHAAAAVADKIIGTLRERLPKLRLSTSVQFVMSDTTASAARVAAELEKRLGVGGGRPGSFDPERDSIEQDGCKMHRVSLAFGYAFGLRESKRHPVEHGLPDGDLTPFADGARLVEICRNIVTFLNAPGRRQKQLADVVRKGKFPEISLKLDGATRIGSVISMMRSLIMNRRAILAYRDEYGTQDGRKVAGSDAEKKKIHPLHQDLANWGLWGKLIEIDVVCSPVHEMLSIVQSDADAPAPWGWLTLQRAVIALGKSRFRVPDAIEKWPSPDHYRFAKATAKLAQLQTGVAIRFKRRLKAQLERRFRQPAERDLVSLALHPLLMDFSILRKWLGYSSRQVDDFRHRARALVENRFSAMRRSFLQQNRARDEAENGEKRAPEPVPEQKKDDHELSFEEKMLAEQMDRGSLRVSNESEPPNPDLGETDYAELERYYRTASKGWQRYVSTEDLAMLTKVAEKTNSEVAMPYERMPKMFKMGEWWRECCLAKYPVVARLVAIWCTKSDANAFIERAFSTLSIVASARANRLKSDAGEHVVMLTKNKGFLDQARL